MRVDLKRYWKTGGSCCLNYNQHLMSLSPFIVIIIAFICLLLLNVFIRVRVLKIYRRLVARRIEFSPVHFFNEKKLQQEVLPRYPEDSGDIKRFISLVRFSMVMASVILIVIIAFGYLLFYSA